jgi:hypothetical protein
MQFLQTTDKNIQFLIEANYQRMMSYEQAAFLTSEPSFKEFYQARADESEANMQQLQLLLNMQESNQQHFAEPIGSHLFHGKKSPIKILESVKTIEKTISNWYKSTIKEIAGLPREIVDLVESQYKALTQAQLQLEHL